MAHSLEAWFFNVRGKIMDYRYADFSHQQHQAIVDQLAARYSAAIAHPQEFERLVARSAVHYLAQSAIRPRRSRWITELAALGLLPVTVLRWWWCGARFSAPAATPVIGVRWLKSRMRYDVTPELYHVPPELAADAPAIAYVPNRYLRGADMLFLLRVWIHGWRVLRAPHLQWCFKVAKEVAWLRPLIEHYPASYALVEDECNAALSVATLYAHRHQQQVYVVQHGDLFIASNTSFFETDRSYCWHEFYVDLLKKLHVTSDFRVYPNPVYALREEEKAIISHGIGVFQPSFLTLTTPEERAHFAAAIRTLAEEYPVSVRPHPAYPQEYEAMRDLYGPKVTLAPTRAETAKQFALRAELVIGTATAALLEALMIGRPVVAVSGVYVRDVAEYHFAYRLPNCQLVNLDDLTATVRRTMTQQRPQALASS